MAGPACKAILNGVLQAITASLEKILTDPTIRGRLLPEEKADKLLQVLADIDLRNFGGTPQDTPTLQQVILDLEQEGVFTDEVWGVLRHPSVPYKPGTSWGSKATQR